MVQSCVVHSHQDTISQPTHCYSISMETHRYNRSNFSYLCDSELCQPLAKLEFRSGIDAPSILVQALAERFPLENAFYRLQLGQMRTITARKDCVSCRFTSALVESCGSNEATPGTVYFASFAKGVICLQHRILRAQRPI